MNVYKQIISNDVNGAERKRQHGDVIDIGFQLSTTVLTTGTSMNRSRPSCSRAASLSTSPGAAVFVNVVGWAEHGWRFESVFNYTVIFAGLARCAWTACRCCHGGQAPVAAGLLCYCLFTHAQVPRTLARKSRREVHPRGFHRQPVHPDVRAAPLIRQCVTRHGRETWASRRRPLACCIYVYAMSSNGVLLLLTKPRLY